MGGEGERGELILKVSLCCAYRRVAGVHRRFIYNERAGDGGDSDVFVSRLCVQQVFARIQLLRYLDADSEKLDILEALDREGGNEACRAAVYELCTCNGNRNLSLLYLKAARIFTLVIRIVDDENEIVAAGIYMSLVSDLRNGQSFGGGVAREVSLSVVYELVYYIFNLNGLFVDRQSYDALALGSCAVRPGKDRLKLAVARVADRTVSALKSPGTVAVFGQSKPRKSVAVGCRHLVKRGYHIRGGRVDNEVIGYIGGHKYLPVLLYRIRRIRDNEILNLRDELRFDRNSVDREVGAVSYLKMHRVLVLKILDIYALVADCRGVVDMGDHILCNGDILLLVIRLFYYVKP